MIWIHEKPIFYNICDKNLQSQSKWFAKRTSLSSKVLRVLQNPMFKFKIIALRLVKPDMNSTGENINEFILGSN